MYTSLLAIVVALLAKEVLHDNIQQLLQGSVVAVGLKKVSMLIDGVLDDLSTNINKKAAGSLSDMIIQHDPVIAMVSGDITLVHVKGGLFLSTLTPGTTITVTQFMIVLDRSPDTIVIPPPSALVVSTVTSMTGNMVQGI